MPINFSKFGRFLTYRCCCCPHTVAGIAGGVLPLLADHYLRQQQHRWNAIGIRSLQILWLIFRSISVPKTITRSLTVGNLLANPIQPRNSLWNCSKARIRYSDISAPIQMQEGGLSPPSAYRDAEKSPLFKERRACQILVIRPPLGPVAEVGCSRRQNKT